MSRIQPSNYPHERKRRHDVPIWPEWHLYEQLKALIPRNLDPDEYCRRLQQAAKKAGV